MAAAAILEKFQMAISPQPVVRSTPCSVLGWPYRIYEITIRYDATEEFNFNVDSKAEYDQHNLAHETSSLHAKVIWSYTITVSTD